MSIWQEVPHLTSGRAVLLGLTDLPNAALPSVGLPTVSQQHSSILDLHVLPSLTHPGVVMTRNVLGYLNERHHHL